METDFPKIAWNRILSNLISFDKKMYYLKDGNLKYFCEEYQCGILVRFSCFIEKLLMRMLESFILDVSHR